MTLARALTANVDGGMPLPMPYKKLRDAGIILTRGETTLIAAEPGAGKSSLALALAVKMEVPTLYVCADTRPHTVAVRLIAMLTGMTQAHVALKMEDDPGWAEGIIAETAPYLAWQFGTEPTIDGISLSIRAYEQVHGDYPHLLIIDNLMDVDVDDNDDEFGGMREVMAQIEVVCEATNAAALVLHHTSEAFTYDVCPPRRAIQGKVSQKPALILTLNTNHADYPNRMLIASVKSRHSAADKTGNSFISLTWDPECMYLADAIFTDEPKGVL